MNAQAEVSLLGQEIKDGQGIPLGEACSLLKPLRGNQVRKTTLASYIVRGVRINGQTVRLEAARWGSRWVTTAKALDRFRAACTAASMHAPTAPTPKLPSGVDPKRAKAAAAKLAKAGA